MNRWSRSGLIELEAWQPLCADASNYISTGMEDETVERDAN